MNTEQKERAKYAQIWANEDYTSGSAIPFAKYIKTVIPDSLSVLEIGCGDGTTINYLWDYCDIMGVDIVTAPKFQAPIVAFTEAPAWDLPFINNAFEYTISTDVLEHLPPDMVGRAISEMLRVTTIATIHAICTRPAVRKYCGYEVHLTVRPLTWWQKEFDKRNIKGLDIKLIEADKL